MQPTICNVLTFLPGGEKGGKGKRASAARATFQWFNRCHQHAFSCRMISPPVSTSPPLYLTVCSPSQWFTASAPFLALRNNPDRRLSEQMPSAEWVPSDRGAWDSNNNTLPLPPVGGFPRRAGIGGP